LEKEGFWGKYFLQCVGLISASVQVVHFCTGPYNTKKDASGKNKAILIGVALDLRSVSWCLNPKILAIQYKFWIDPM
jgi:hypothetical protein